MKSNKTVYVVMRTIPWYGFENICVCANRPLAVKKLKEAEKKYPMEKIMIVKETVLGFYPL